MANQQEAAAIQAQKNQRLMRIGYSQPIQANAQNGNAYKLGDVLNFDVPIIAGAYVEKVRLYYDVNFTNTPGGTPGLNKTAAAEHALFPDIGVTFGNKQVSIHPYITKVLNQLRGYNRFPTNGVSGGNFQAGISSLLYAGSIASGANNWKGYYDLPMTLVHPSSPYGLIPIGGSGTRMQIQLQTAQSLVGPDPLNNAMFLAAGATNVVSAVTGTVKVVIFYRDFKSFVTPASIDADLTNIPTAQVIRLRDASPLAAGTPNYLAVTNPYPFVKTIHLVIDGKQSDKFSAASNLEAFRIDGAENTASVLRAYDVTTGGMANYYTRHREVYGADLDEGVLTYDANSENAVDSSDQEGETWLNVSGTGYPAARVGFQVGSVDTSKSITPRVVSYGIIINAAGIV